MPNFHHPIPLLSPWGLKIHQLMEISPNISLARSVQKWWIFFYTIYHLYHDYVIHTSSKSITKAQTTTSLIDTRPTILIMYNVPSTKIYHSCK
jgi:hypothetical protein